MSFPLWLQREGDDSSDISGRHGQMRLPAVPQLAPEQTATDRETLQRLRDGDVEALETLYRTHYSDLVGFAQAVTGNREIAPEIVQEVFVSLWERRQELNVTGSLRGYLFTAVRYRALNTRRAARAADRLEQNVQRGIAIERPRVTTPEDDALQADQQALFQRTIATLPARQREALLLRYEGQLTFEEIGATMSLSADAARKLVSRAYTELRRLLAPYLAE